jgi:tRNA-dihydrouridine synthase A
MRDYSAEQLRRHGANGHGLRLNSITRHMLGLTAGMPGARLFRQMLSDPRRLAANDPDLLLDALAAMPANAAHAAAAM